MELRDYLRVVRRRWMLIVACLLVTVGVGAAFTYAATPLYSSSARLFVSTTPSDTSDAYQGGLFSAQRVTSYADLVKTDELAETVIDEVGLEMTPDELREQVEAKVTPETVILQVTATDPSPERAQRIAQGYAEALTELVRELETAEGGDVAPIKATVVDGADVDESPVSPQPLRNLGLAAVLGLLLGFGAAVVRELLDTSIKSADDVQTLTEAPVMGAISFDSAVRQRPLVTDLEPQAPRVEAFRVLRTNMQFVDVDHDSKAFVVSSSVPEEGKTTVAVNLAITLAQAGHRTILVECDLRRPRVASNLGIESGIGVTTVLLGKLTLDETVQVHPPSGLHVLTSGAIPPNPAELLQSQAMRTLMSDLRGRYDHVVIDAPPLLPVTDAALLATHADGVLLVVRHGSTTTDQLEHAIERLQGVEARLLGVVLNRVPTRGPSRYGYGYGYAADVEADEVVHKNREMTGSGRRRAG